MLWIFRRAIEGFKSDRPGGLQNIQLDFASLRNDRRSQERYGDARQAGSRRPRLQVAASRTRASVTWSAVDLFEETDQKIISDLARAVAEQTVTAARGGRGRAGTAEQRLDRRLQAALHGRSPAPRSCWASWPRSISSCSRSTTDWSATGASGSASTSSTGSSSSPHRTAEYPKPLEALREQVEKRYTNKFVYELGNAWQQQVDQVDKWRSTVLRSQTAFYARYVEPLVRDGDKKAVVIISDAMRYEVADELGSLIRQEDRFDANLEAVLGVLPSYTQLGMAALLPHSTLKHSADAKTVLADDQPTNGTAFRGKILEGVGGSAIQAEDFKALNADERRELYKANRVLYVYHNRIDATGDKPGTERQVFEAVEDTLRDIVDLVKKLASANATNIFITADHGFLFQDEALADTFFLSTQPQGDDIKVVNRRYVLGQRPQGRHRLHHLQGRPARARQRPGGPDPQVDPPAPAGRRRLTIRPRRGDAAGDRRSGAGGQQEAQERHPAGQRRGLARVGQDHHRAGRRPAVPDRAGERQGPAPHASCRALRRRDPDLEPDRA